MLALQSGVAHTLVDSAVSDVRGQPVVRAEVSMVFDPKPPVSREGFTASVQVPVY